MSYSDYGGYAYRNGKHIIDRSDATITSAGDVFGIPGLWPGFVKDFVGEEAKSWPSGHVVLGDGPIYVVLYKQSNIRIYRWLEQLDLLEILPDEYSHLIKTFQYDDSGKKYFDCDNDKCHFDVDGYRIDYITEYTNNFYQYAKLTQPDGVVWAGWSGYGVGAGLEDAGYGYSTEYCENRIKKIYPEAFK